MYLKKYWQIELLLILAFCKNCPFVKEPFKSRDLKGSFFMVGQFIPPNYKNHANYSPADHK